MKGHAILPFVALVAYLGTQSEGSAKTIGNPFPSFTVPPATGSFRLIACDSSGNCSGTSNEGIQVQFPPDLATQTIKRGTNSAKGTINYNPSLFSSSISARLDGYPGSVDYVLFTYFFGFGYPPGVTGEIGAAVTANIQTSGKVSGDRPAWPKVGFFRNSNSITQFFPTMRVPQHVQMGHLKVLFPMLKTCTFTRTLST